MNEYVLYKYAEHLAQWLGYTMTDLCVKSRAKDLVIARQMIMSYLNQRQKFITSEVGNVFNLDHSTVIHSNKCINNMVEFEKPFAKYWQEFCDYADKFKQSTIELSEPEFMDKHSL